MTLLLRGSKPPPLPPKGGLGEASSLFAKMFIIYNGLKVPPLEGFREALYAAIIVQAVLHLMIDTCLVAKNLAEATNILTSKASVHFTILAKLGTH